MKKSSISFGLVNIPITINPILQDNDVSFNQLHKKCLTRIKYVKYCPHCKKILKDSCSEFDELWMIDEKSYLIVSPGKSKDEITQLVNTNLKTIENFRFIYKQDIITPKIHVAYLDKQSKPSINILDELIKQIAAVNEQYNES